MNYFVTSNSFAKFKKDIMGFFSIDPANTVCKLFIYYNIASTVWW